MILSVVGERASPGECREVESRGSLNAFWLEQESCVLIKAVRERESLISNSADESAGRARAGATASQHTSEKNNIKKDLTKDDLKFKI